MERISAFDFSCRMDNEAVDCADLCATIIEKALRKARYCENMWEEPIYSKSQINKAGSVLTDTDVTAEERESALTILNNWRAAHAYPLQCMGDALRDEFYDAIVVHRLKRLESIVGKLSRFPDMCLYRMQDLGGCRVIVNTIDQIYEAVERFKIAGMPCEVCREYDYVEKPKVSGYRSYHVVCKFKESGETIFNKNMLLEIQFRTRLQHSWATAVEVMGLYTKSNLKSSMGNEDILRFFVLVSSIFAVVEGKPVCPGTDGSLEDVMDEIRKLQNRYKVLDTLDGLKFTIDYGKSNDADYYLMALDYNNKKVFVEGFPAEQLPAATVAYGDFESRTDRNVVLVSAASLTELREAYPNYFVDVSVFVFNVKKFFVDYEDGVYGDVGCCFDRSENRS